jgi:hypothetical protein
MALVKTLLDPITRGDEMPQGINFISGRNRRSRVYQDPEQRYLLGTFPSIAIPPHSTDKFYVVEANDKGRPDIIAYKMYGDPAYYWIILWINGILDPLEAIYPGMLLRIPLSRRLASHGVQI